MVYFHERRVKAWAFLAFLVWLAAGCCAPRLSFVAVRERDFTFGPVGLPLQAADRVTLETFLKKGGDWDVEGEAEPMAPTTYKGLLDRLSDPAFVNDIRNFVVRDKEAELAEALRQWLAGPALYQVVDAKDERPPWPVPLAAADRWGRFAWVFFRLREGDTYRASQLVVTRNILGELKH
jgi:hypothetical protein